MKTAMIIIGCVIVGIVVFSLLSFFIDRAFKIIPNGYYLPYYDSTDSTSAVLAQQYGLLVSHRAMVGDKLSFPPDCRVIFDPTTGEFLLRDNPQKVKTQKEALKVLMGH